MTVESILKLLNAGCSLRIGLYNVDSLELMADAAANSGAELTIVGSMGMDAMLRVVEAGQGQVVWDIVDKA